MLLSMTGYGRAMRTFGEKVVIVEVRALNSKMTDIRFKMPLNYKEKELELRKIITDATERGKIDVGISIRSIMGEEVGHALNHDLFRRYYRELTTLSAELGFATTDILSAIVRLPSVVGTDENSVEDEEWQMVTTVLADALQAFKQFRLTEGGAMERDLAERLAVIQDLLVQVAPFEEARKIKVRAKLRQNLDDFMSRDNVDEHRFEQEILFYLEKMDITEEKVRLLQHCKYFTEQLADTRNMSKGRSLNFIAQEIGREINTMGSKAYSHDIQHLVVRMKDELEKIKELVANLV